MKTTDSHDSFESLADNNPSSEEEETPKTIDPRARVALLAAGLAERGLLPILDEACQRGHVTREEILGKSRARHIVKARQELWWLLRRHENSFSLHEIGKLFLRHHTSVLAGVRAHEFKMQRAVRFLAPGSSSSQYSPTGATAPTFDSEATAVPASVHH